MRPGPARLAAAAAIVIAGLLGAAQLVLPMVAERRLRERLERVGEVREVDIHAFPALRLLWGGADRVVVRMGSTGAGTGRLADLLARARQTGELDATAERLRVLLLALRDVRLRKRGAELTGEATVTAEELEAALPPGFKVRPVASGGGALVFEGSAEIFGRRYSGRVVVLARDGRLLLAPDLPLGALLALTIFEDQRMEVTDVGARPHPRGFTLTAEANLR